MSCRHEDIIKQAHDLTRSGQLIAEKRGMDPASMAMSAAHSLAACLGTSATLNIIAGSTRSEAVAAMKENALDIFADLMGRAIHGVMVADIPATVVAMNEKFPEHKLPAPRDGWDD